MRQIAEFMVAALNEILTTDRDALESLISHRVRCSDALADHATVQVAERPDGGYEVGLLGILNGIAGCDANKYGAIIAHFYECRLSHFSVNQNIK